MSLFNRSQIIESNLLVEDDEYDSGSSDETSGDENSGSEICEPYKKLKTIDQFFKAIFSEQLLKQIINCTNIRLKSKFGETFPLLTFNELNCFMGPLILYGMKNQRKTSVKTQ